MDHRKPIQQLPVKRTHLLLLANAFFWISFGIFDILSTGGALNGYYSAISVRFLLHAFLFAALIYPNLYYLYPKFFSKGRYIPYSILALALLFIINYLRIALDEFLLTYESARNIFGSIYDQDVADGAIKSLTDAGFYTPGYGFHTPYYVGMAIGTMGVFFITTPIRLVEDWYNKKQLEIQLLKNQLEQKQAAIRIREEKLKFLKAQTDPHFLINAISGVYHLALLESQKVDHALLRLSELMGYLLGYGKQDEIALKHEVQFIENYIDFNATIYQDEFDIHFHHNASTAQLETILLPPMLFQPFFENAFKYSSYSKKKATIKSELEVHARYLRFYIENTFTPSRSSGSQPISFGIGINNVKERLKLFLPDRHSLQITAEKRIFKVELLLFIDHELYTAASGPFDHTEA
jgi:sensor histidine kinase YesM